MHGEDTADFWDGVATTFDDAPDHGLADPGTRQAWVSLLDDVLGESHGLAVDLGCGTGSVSMLLAERGHGVYGVDVSPRMIELAQAKARRAGLEVDFVVGDLESARVPSARVGAVLSRHVLWLASDLDAVVARWSAPLAADGVFIAIEGVWGQAGVAAETMFAALRRHFEHVAYRDLSGETPLWGVEVSDQRYAMVGRNPRRN